MTEQEKNISGQRQRGRVKWFSRDKGYGFITRENGEDLFVHYSAIEVSGFRYLLEGQTVEFNEINGTKGPAAVNVKALDTDEKQ